MNWLAHTFFQKRFVIFVGAFFLVGLVISSLFLLKQKSPRVQGAVDSEYIVSHIQECFSSSGANRCYLDAAKDFFKRFGLVNTLAALGDNAAQPGFENCHEVTHYLGREAYKNDKALAKVLQTCTPACFGGCYHGALEEYFIEKNISPDLEDDQVIINQLPRLCGREEDYGQRELFNQCLHGLGHALMFLLENDLPRALKFCDALPNGDEAEWCYSGVFMENSNSSTNKDHPSEYVKPDDPIYPCTILEEPYLNMCYTMQGFYYAHLVQYEWKEVVEFCGSIPSKYQSGCFHSIGQFLAQFGSDPDPVVIKENCEFIIEDEFVKVCIDGAVSAFSSRFSGNPSSIIEFCSVVDTEQKGACYRSMGRWLQNWARTPQELYTSCSQILDEEYKQLCSSAGLENKIENQ